MNKPATEKSMRWRPMIYVLLDLVGTVLLLTGLMEWFMQIGLVPDIIRFPFFEWLLMALGVMLMMPLITFIVFKYKKTRE